MAESGHKKNVDNLQTAVNFATGWGATYQPSNPMLAVAAMTAAVASGDGQIDGVQTNRTPYRNATAACDDAFEAAFGRGSTEWNQIKGLEFITYTRK